MKTLKRTSNYTVTQTHKTVLAVAEKIRSLFRINATASYPVNSDYSQIPAQDNSQHEALAYALDLEFRQAIARTYANTLPLR
jgi:hypothetical protein